MLAHRTTCFLEDRSSYVSQVIGGGLVPDDRDGVPLTVSDVGARLYALSPGTFAVDLEIDGCAYSLDDQVRIPAVTGWKARRIRSGK